ncbi:MarR family winged helix-turn-helix transcriptional regulator [Sphingobacterium zeae]|uniref:DNA-binding MarR family transcriptional regulator n=1 Tax=Sphingobacterium zeae TaxID=1776859 RepID=A0ABU0U3C3_9SPHI|nr:MarR family transcriptional regulator [Sphingobacterium zeae]MDQ1149450.1 DNA-binding MarR family transcriptional regulator [Sphingobacterium zeae]
MKIEDEIKVNKFSNEWHRCTVNILYTYNRISNALEQRAAKEGITLKQFNVLRILRGRYPKPSTNSLIKSRMLSFTPDISRMIDRMVSKELVSRCQSGADKRAVDLFITKKGQEILKRLDEDMLMMDILPSRISEEEAIALNALLDKLRG